MVESLSRETAQEHIEEIRRGKGLNDGQAQNQNVSDLERALKIVSDELYHQSTHFLLELIQNANDNSYDTSSGITPTLDISLYDDYLRVDCNETGFAPRNVEAICKVGSSTKAGVGNATRYVGEKGIGFKSVFKVADVVYINSCDYSFKFEKNGPLGMIAPIWCDFPAKTKSGHTTIFMHLAHDCNKEDLRRDILFLDSRMLIFLRQLRRINIRIETASSVTLSRSLSRFPDVPLRSASVVTLQQDSKVFKYLVLNHTAKRLPLEPKREGVQESQILLAFPVEENLEPKLEQQQVYAFLPVRDYGLQFLLQADFLLIASREDVDDSSEWNRALRNSAIDGLIEAGKSFNTGSMKYMWPRYFPGKANVSGFFESFKGLLLKRIASEKVLESADGQFMAPSTLISCPSKFCDNDGRPLTATAANSCRYLSPKYKSDDQETLATFGVQEMTGGKFVCELFNLTKEDPAFLCNQSLEWHSYLATALSPLCSDRQLSLQIAALKLIPLRDKRWASVEEGTIFFPGDRHGLTIPDGVDLLVVEYNAAADPCRKHLYRILGAQDFSVILLCKLILSIHNDPKFNPRSATNSALLSQILFLFNAGCIIDKTQRFWCVQECGISRSPASGLYLESDQPLSASKLLGTAKSRFHFLHSSYIDAAPDDQERWRKWLVDSLRVAIYPRLVVTAGEDSFRLSEDFQWLLMHRPSSEFLVLLRDQWHIYAPYMENDDTKGENHRANVSRKLMRERLSLMGVKCRDGIIRQAGKTHLPTNELVAAAKGCIAFLDVPNPQDTRWELVFHTIQVGLKDDLDFYLQALQALKVTSATKDRVSNFLEQIQARSNSDFPKVKKAFLDNSLVYIPSSSLNELAEWVTPTSCVWDGPKCLRTIHVLKDLYPQNGRLFCTILGIEDANIATLVREARAITMSSGLGYILSLFLEVEKILKDNTAVNMPVATRKLKIFPIRNVGSVTGYDSLLSADSVDEWFIADCSHFHRSFAGKIPLLALDIADIGRLKRLLQKANVEKRSLSIISNGSAQTNGGVSFLDVETRALRSKVNSILRLIPDNEINRMKIFQQFRTVSVSKAPRVIQSWSVKYGNQTIQGEPEDGFVALSSNDGKLHIYFAEKTIGSRRSNSELVEKLSSFCGFDKAEDGIDRYYLLLCVIIEDSRKEINTLFDKHTVPPLVTDGELVAEEERVKKLEAKASQNNTNTDVGNTVTHQSATAGQMSPVTPLKTNASYMTIAALAEKILLQQIKVFTVSGDVAAQGSSSDWVMFARNLYGGSSSKSTSPSYMLDADISPGPNGVPSMENIQLISLKRSMRNHDLDRLQSLGEVFVHKILQTKILGNDYDPEQHWTSRHRTTSGYSPLPFEGPHNTKANFTIDDSTGVLTQFLTKLTKTAECWLNKPPTYHLEVKTTAGGLLDQFNLSHTEFVRARRCRTPDYGYPTDVSVLVRVWNIEAGEPQMTLFVNTWAWYISDRVLMQAIDGFRAHVRSQ